MVKKFLVVCGLLMSFLLLSACEEDIQITRHVSGIYMGPVDPLVSKGPLALNERFMTIQSDR